MNKPLGMLAFKDIFGDMQYTEATQIRRIVDLRVPKEHPGFPDHQPTRSVVKLINGTEIGSPVSGKILVAAYHDIIHGRPAAIDDAAGCDG